MTDKRLIDATEVERVFNQWLGEADSLAEQEAIECCIAHIHDTPAVDPKSLRGHARWVKNENVKIITVDVYGNTFESPVAAAVICGLLVWFVIDCLEASSWAEEDVKMPGFHVSAGIGGIYAGITNSKGEWKDRDRVTTEAVEAVRDYFLAIRETDGVDSMEYKWVTGDGSEVTLTLRKTVPENGGPNAE